MAVLKASKCSGRTSQNWTNMEITETLEDLLLTLCSCWQKRITLSSLLVQRTCLLSSSCMHLFLAPPAFCFSLAEQPSFLFPRNSQAPFKSSTQLHFSRCPSLWSVLSFRHLHRVYWHLPHLPSPSHLMSVVFRSSAQALVWSCLGFLNSWAVLWCYKLWKWGLLLGLPMPPARKRLKKGQRKSYWLSARLPLNPSPLSL